jgi:hypothetical protein
METRLFEIQGDHLNQISNERHVAPEVAGVCLWDLGQSCSSHADTNSSLSVTTGKSETPPCFDRRPLSLGFGGRHKGNMRLQDKRYRR